MEYLERNRHLLEEIRQLGTLRRGKVVGESDFSGTKFTSLGSYDSKVLGIPLFLGLKEYKGDGWTYFLDQNLTLLDAISKSPALKDEIPLVYGHLQDMEWRDIGVICEDFSQGGRFEVKDIHYRQTDLIPHELREIFGVSRFELDDKDQLEHVGFIVNSRRRLGDFNNLSIGNTPRLRSRIIDSPIYREIGSSLDQYIIRAELK